MLRLKKYKETLSTISIIIPVGKWDKSWHSLLKDLELFPSKMEIIFSSPTAVQKQEEKLLHALKMRHHVKWILSQEGRGVQLNTGAKAATRKFLWFLHGDSRFQEKAIYALARSLEKKEKALHYFNLAFLPDGPPVLMLITTLAVYFRSTLLKLPWGDQGYCIHKELFHAINAYPENLPFGEDHALLWKLSRKNIPIQSTGASLYTSARKYGKHGWFAITWLHFKRTISQAYTEWKKKDTVLNYNSSVYVKKKYNQNRKKVAVATFVKTPSFSPVKTRLAKTLGRKKTEIFYSLSLHIIEELYRSFSLRDSSLHISPYWLVAEKKALALDIWKKFPSLWQGEGSLGERLYHSYNLLLQEHDYLVFLGMDSPQITKKKILESVSFLEKGYDFSFGPALDGGFYLFAGRKNIPKHAWTKLTYSTNTTLKQLKANLDPIGKSILLKTTLRDIDTEIDLQALYRYWKHKKLSPDKKRLQEWIKETILNEDI